MNHKKKIQFWAKTTTEGRPGITVFEHMINVGCVAQCIAERAPELLIRFVLSAKNIGAIAALHDLGKISPGFQRKCEIWLRENNLEQIARNCVWDNEMESDHSKVTHAAVQQYLNNLGIDSRSAKLLAAILGAHHGRLNQPNDRGFMPTRSITDSVSGINWDEERFATAKAICTTFGMDLKDLRVDDSSPSLWWLAGLTTVADWIGSDEKFFPSKKDVSKSKIEEITRKALSKIGFFPPEIITGLSFHDLFHDVQKPDLRFFPNEIQSKALSTITAPGVYIIEAPMGMGKTEAALVVAYQLMAQGKARGIYFALPTQATSNRIHLRMKDFVKRITTGISDARLIHSNSWLMDTRPALSPIMNTKQDSNHDLNVGQNWFSSARRALISTFGVGTIDQALLGVVAAKHFFVRHFALAGKVVILDEVHSYDLYTGTLIDKLINTLEGLGCTVIILSATLSGKRRGQIIILPEDSNDSFINSYPLITGRKEGDLLKPVAATPPAETKIEVEFIQLKTAQNKAISLAKEGGTVLWICNTVDAAQEQYRSLLNAAAGQFPVGLLHSRFTFWRREELENVWMERLGKSGATRCGSILISTQIVEQSVDLDADLIITELSPTDMMLQRLGRLWRHQRGERPILKPRICILEQNQSLEEFKRMEASAIVEALGGNAWVYDPFVLLRSLEVWKEISQVTIPTDIRSLIEATYKERNHEPPGWHKLFENGCEKAHAHKMKALLTNNIWQVALNDEEGIQTRLNEMPTVAVVLCLKMEQKKVSFIDGTSGLLGDEEFQLKTAQGLHRNLVKVPRHHFQRLERFIPFERYIREALSIGIVNGNGEVKVNGLKDGVRLYWSEELGMMIEKNILRSER